MSAAETAATAPVVPVEEVKPTETVPAEPSAPAEAPKEDAAAPVSFLCFFVPFLCLLLFLSYFFSSSHKDVKKADVVQVGQLPCLLFLCSYLRFFFSLSGGCSTRNKLGFC